MKSCRVLLLFLISPSNLLKTSVLSWLSSFFILLQLLPKSCKIRDREVANELVSFVKVLANEMSLEDFASVEDEVLGSVFKLMHSSKVRQKMAGVAAINALVGMSPSADEERKAVKCANALGNCLRSVNIAKNHNDCSSGDCAESDAGYQFLDAVARALGRMARGAADVDYVECEAARALEWLRTNRTVRRLAAVLVLRELARNAPSVFFSKTSGGDGSNEFLDHIFPVLRDPHPIVRVCAADALSECLKVLIQRRDRGFVATDGRGGRWSTISLLCKVHTNIMDGFREDRSSLSSSLGGVGVLDGGILLSSSVHDDSARHASLLALGDMFDRTGDFMLPRFDEACRAVLNLTDHPRDIVRLEVIRLVPKLARRCPGSFRRRYLKRGLIFVLECASSVEPTPPQKIGLIIDLRNVAYRSLGQLALIMAEGNEGDGAPLTSLHIEGDENYYKSNDNRNDKTIKDGNKDNIVSSIHSKGSDFSNILRRISGRSIQETIDSHSSVDTTSSSTSALLQPLARGGAVGSSVDPDTVGSLPALTPLSYTTRGGDIHINLDCIFSLVREGLKKSNSYHHDYHSHASLDTNTKSNMSNPENVQSEALRCAAALVNALGKHAAPYIPDLLDDMFRSGLSSNLIGCLHAIAEMIPSETNNIENRLLQELSLCLAGTVKVDDLCDPLGFKRRNTSDKVEHHHGNSSRAIESATSGLLPPTNNREPNNTATDRTNCALPMINMSEETDVVTKVVLSLRTLGSFWNVMGGRSIFYGTVGTILPFIRNVVAQYLTHPSSNGKYVGGIILSRLSHHL